MPDNIFTVETEFGVHGYSAARITYMGTLAEVKAKIEKAHIAFARKLVEAEERDGDLRRYCPEFGNGYPNLSGLDSAEYGVDFDITILSVKSTKTVITEVEYDYHDSVYTALREAAGEEITEGWDSKAYRVNALGAQQKRCLIEAHRRYVTFYPNMNPLMVWSGLGYKSDYKTTVADGFMRWAGDGSRAPDARQQGWLILTEKGVEMVGLLGLEL